MRFDFMQYSLFNQKQTNRYQNYCTARLLSVLCPITTCECPVLLPPKTLKKRNAANCIAGFKGHHSLNLGVLLPLVASLALQKKLIFISPRHKLWHIAQYK